MNILQTLHLGKTIRGRKVLTDIQLELSGGKIYAFCGENGSGKTMLFRSLSGLSRPTEGSLFLNGIDPYCTRRPLIGIGIILSGTSLYPQFTGFENLNYLASLRHLITNDAIRSAMNRVGLDPTDRRTVREYSLGMKQRLLMAQAVMEQPDFLFLDEPTNGIDTDGTKLLYTVIRQEAERGAVVCLSSHIDRDVSMLADEVYLVKEGEVHRA